MTLDTKKMDKNLSLSTVLCRYYLLLRVMCGDCVDGRCCLI